MVAMLENSEAVENSLLVLLALEILDYRYAQTSRGHHFSVSSSKNTRLNDFNIIYFTYYLRRTSNASTTKTRAKRRPKRFRLVRNLVFKRGYTAETSSYCVGLLIKLISIVAVKSSVLVLDIKFSKRSIM